MDIIDDFILIDDSSYAIIHTPFNLYPESYQPASSSVNVGSPGKLYIDINELKTINAVKKYNLDTIVSVISIITVILLLLVSNC
jgi:hypothetical protein